ncbi:clan AA aspartic protease [Marichromatium purpuratum 984]|uniref:Clan AA aspartic protease n=1 Tax=Marichromatium purpuratum 984 TaxID=765910 RepID=W0DYJ6_MARPU|nr:clan AA aspartic protease [Marichromatium purpuratum 984]
MRGRIGGSAVTFRLAPEADTVVLGEREATRLGLVYARGRLVRHQGTTGVGLGYAVELDSVQVGGIVRERVAAVVVIGEETGEVLLGQSFLRGLTRCRAAGAIVLRALYR